MIIRRKNICVLSLCLICCFIFSACTQVEQENEIESEPIQSPGTQVQSEAENGNVELDIPEEPVEMEAEPAIEEPQIEEVEDMSLENEVQTEDERFLVVIDPGHQRKGNSAKEPIGPGATETKAKVTGGTQGTTTGIPEYELTLHVSLKLGVELEKRGYTVMYTRTTHDVDISNSERAEIANTANADAFIRIHANGSTNPSISGAMTICQTPKNPYNGTLYEASKELSENVLDELVKATGCRKEYVWETDTMSGVNWCAVPVTIVEMGYMTNPEEDRLLNTEEYQDKIVQGIANGIDLTLVGE